MNVLLLSRDLVISSQVEGAASRTGVAVTVCHDSAQATAICREQAIDLVLVDLSIASLNVADVVDSLRDASDHPIRICAFGPHVHEGKLQAAREAGCNEVISRGQLHATLDRVLRPA